MDNSSLPASPGLPASSGERLSRPPVTLLAVSGVLGLAGVALLGTVVGWLLLTLAAMAQAAESSYTFLPISLLLQLDAFALSVGLIATAIQLPRANRTARILAFVVLGFVALAISCVAADGVRLSGGYLVALLVAVSCVGLLGFSPTTSRYFASHTRPDHGRPPSVVAARIVLSYVSANLLIGGLELLSEADVHTGHVVTALVLAGVGAGGLVASWGLRRSSVRARQLATVIATAFGLFYLWSTAPDITLAILPLALSALPVGLLYLPVESRRYFRPPLAAQSRIDPQSRTDQSRTEPHGSG